MKKVNVTTRAVWIWDCPTCEHTNKEEADGADGLDLVCENCEEEFELGEVFEDV